MATAYLVNRGELGADGAAVVAGTAAVAVAVVEPARRALPAAVQDPAGRLFAFERPRGRLVAAELGAALAVSVRRAGRVQALVDGGAGRQALGDVFAVGGGTAFVGAGEGARGETVRVCVYACVWITYIFNNN